jgi:hypothetical protein
MGGMQDDQDRAAWYKRLHMEPKEVVDRMLVSAGVGGPHSVLGWVA